MCINLLFICILICGFFSLFVIEGKNFFEYLIIFLLILINVVFFMFGCFKILWIMFLFFLFIISMFSGFGCVNNGICVIIL